MLTVVHPGRCVVFRHHASRKSVQDIKKGRQPNPPPAFSDNFSVLMHIGMRTAAHYFVNTMFSFVTVPRCLR